MGLLVLVNNALNCSQADIRVDGENRSADRRVGVMIGQNERQRHLCKVVSAHLCSVGGGD